MPMIFWRFKGRQWRLRDGAIRLNHRQPRKSAEGPRPDLVLVHGSEEVATELSATPAQVALAWLMARPSITTPIASVTSVEQLQELMGGARLQLPTDAIAKLDTASAG